MIIRRKIEVVPYQELWPGLYQAEANRFRSVVQEEIIEMHHVGSTAVPGLAAKPIIDILVVGRSLGGKDEFIQGLLSRALKWQAQSSV